MSITTQNKEISGGTTTNKPGSSIVNTYQWWDGAVQNTVVYDSDTGNSGNALWTTSYTYAQVGGAAQLTSAGIVDGRPRTVTYRNDVNGQAIRRDEADGYNDGDPHEIWYRFAGREVGFNGNNGTLDLDYISTLQMRDDTGAGAFRGGAGSGAVYADFDKSLPAISSYYQGSRSGSHVVRQGETLESIAGQIWGDASLWYKLAEANGLSGGAPLIEGQTLSIPTGVIRNSFNASTFKPFDPAETVGDTAPTAPKPPKVKKNKCGVIGQILLVVIAIAVTAISGGWAGAAARSLGFAAGTTGNAIVGGAIAGAAGSVASTTSVGKRGGRSDIWLEAEELHLIDSKIGPSPIFRATTTGVQ